MSNVVPGYNFALNDDVDWAAAVPPTGGSFPLQRPPPKPVDPGLEANEHNPTWLFNFPLPENHAAFEVPCRMRERMEARKVVRDRQRREQLRHRQSAAVAESQAKAESEISRRASSKRDVDSRAKKEAERKAREKAERQRTIAHSDQRATEESSQRPNDEARPVGAPIDSLEQAQRRAVLEELDALARIAAELDEGLAHATAAQSATHAPIVQTPPQPSVFLPRLTPPPPHPSTPDPMVATSVASEPSPSPALQRASTTLLPSEQLHRAAGSRPAGRPTQRSQVNPLLPPFATSDAPVEQPSAPGVQAGRRHMMPQRSNTGDAGGPWEISDFSYESLLELGSNAVSTGLDKKQIARYKPFAFKAEGATGASIGKKATKVSVPRSSVSRGSAVVVECSICIEAMENGQPALRLGCGHVFHHCCIVAWLARSNRCPTCRYEIERAKR